MLSREECLKVLELEPKATPNDIEHRYTMLIKRYRGKDDPETLARLDEITLAYNILTGRYVEPEKPDPRMDQVVFGKTKRQWKNIWHYGRWTLLAGIAGLAILISLIYSIVTNKTPDFQIAVTGLYTTDADVDTRVDRYVKSILTNVENLEFQVLPLDMSQSESQSQYAYFMKMMALASADSIEVYICDKPVFDQYAPEGAYADLTDLYERLQDLPKDVLDQIKPLRRKPSQGNATLASGETAPTETVSTEDAANQDQSLPIYGLDVTGLKLIEKLGLSSDTQVLTIGSRASDAAAAEKFLEAWIRDR